MSSSSSYSPSSSAAASWYCWYSETRSFMLDSASVNSISSIPSPVYQWRKALRRNMPVNCSETRFQSSWMAVELPMKMEAILRPLGGDVADGHADTEEGRASEVPTVTGVSSAHHVL